MKTLNLVLAAGISLFAAGCGSSSTITADTTTANPAVVVDVPSSVQTEFASRYPSATGVTWSYYNTSPTPIEWELTDWQMLTPQDYVVTYSMDNNDHYAWYDANGVWIGSAYAVKDYSSLPVAVNKAISLRYPGYTVLSAHTETWRDQTGYELELKNNNDTKVKVLLDPNGNVLKEKVKTK